MLRPFSIYIHVPFCRTRCDYCNFNSYAVAEIPEAAYSAALIQELESYGTRESWRGDAVWSVYFGGGTPSLFSPESIGRVIETIRRLWPPFRRHGEDANHGSRERPAIEITLEANPGTVDVTRLCAFSAVGVNRLSFGVQSFQASNLGRLGRTHSAEEARSVVEQGREAGFGNISVDLMFAIPGQTLTNWELDLQTAVRFGPDHVSTYNLTYEEGTRLRRLRDEGRLQPIDEDSEASMMARTVDVLAEAGYQHYEVSNHARPGRESLHNINYWRGGEYLGIGAGAHSFSRQPAPGHRWANEKNPGVYLKRIDQEGDARAFEERLDERQARGEFVFLGLRTSEGINETDFVARFGVEFCEAFPHVAELLDDGLIWREGPRWRLSERGFMVADSVFVTFL